MTTAPTTRTALPLGTRAAGSPIGTKISTPKILTIGDSQTAASVTSGNSWIQPVDAKLIASGITPTWVGNQSGGSPLRSHRGISGTAIPNHRAGGSTDTVTYVASLAPDVVIIALGSNDALSDTDRDNYDTNALGIATEIMTARAATNRFVLVKTFDCEDATRKARLDVINNTEVPSAKTLIEGAGGLVVVCDYRVLIVNGHLNRGEGSSKLHMQSADGYALLASALFPVIVNACGYAAVWEGDAVS
jgi:lysophospholipase L1-like esterase